MTKKALLILFFGIFLLGSFLRFYELGNIPNSLEWDEVSIGYNAYSILQTGKDEYGEFFPSAFRAFGEYKQPIYIYLDAVSISMFGLNAFAVRLPSAVFGSISIILVYFLTFELFRKYKIARTLALVSMLSFAISPWSIQFSRAAFEANVSLAFVIAGVWLFLRGLYVQKKWYFFLSIFSLILSTYTYISAKLIVPLLLISLIIYGLHYFKSRKRFAILLVGLFLIVSSLWVLDTRSVSRSQGVLFTVNQTFLLENTLPQLAYDNKNDDNLGTVVHNWRVIYGQKVITNYLSHFNPLWLYVTGDSDQRHHAPGVGILYLVSLPFILAGMYFLISRYLATAWILFVWFLLAPFASSLTLDAPHSIRSLLFLPTWQIFEAAGIVFLFQMLRKRWLLYSVSIVCMCLFATNFVYYLHQYFVHTDSVNQVHWQYGYKEAIDYVTQEQKNKKIVFAKSFEQPHVFYLFYTRYNPEKYIETGSTWRTTKKCYTIDTAYLGDCKDQLKKGDIFVVTWKEEGTFGRELKRFNFADGKPATIVYEYQ